MDTPIVRVSAGILQDTQGRIFMSTRPTGKMCAGQWEFPGGKVEQGETDIQALYRELQEEIGVTVCMDSAVLYDTVRYMYDTFILHMPVFWCRHWTGTPIGKEGQRIAWVAIPDISQLDIVVADIPLIQKIQADKI